ncbi:helix-turn-helix domain-containing protein [Methanoregula sp. UBA64]|jgi:hypothetical protein|uniref:AlbA family DNA-binding domain-containing protein n=1 Tax=Methanoregula sp. UBA64 TaxID=1915554 RepID=UPI0025F7A271|nr:ATP-binding protein [Methanoregula sp. UBA64]
MIQKNKIDEIDLEDLQKLIDNEIPEGRTIEYKEKINVGNDEEKREFLADISSFANTDGGDIIFGITENRNTGFPEKIVGLDITNADEEIRRINSIIQNGLQPRITPPQSHSIKLSTGKYVIIIRIKKSWNSPHRIIFKGWDKFCSRNSKGKYQLDVIELRNAFNLSESRFDKISTFINRRIHSIHYGDSPLQTIETPKVILHVIPINAFDPQTLIDFTQYPEIIKDIATLTDYKLIGTFNSDGKVKIGKVGEKNPYEYVQLFRNGIIESVGSNYLIGIEDSCIPLTPFEEKIIDASKNYLLALKGLNIEGPIIIFLTLVGVQKFTRCTDKNRYPMLERDIPQIQKEILTLPEVMIEEYNENIENILKKTFDALANACGLEKSQNYDENGNRKKQ